MKRTVRLARRILTVVGAIEASFAAVFLAVILVLVLALVVLRYVPVMQSAWAAELARYSLVWLTFVAVGVLVSRNEHPQIESIDAIVKDGVGRRIVLVFANLAIAAVSIAFAVDVGALVFDDVPTTTAVMRIPIQLAMLPTFIGFILASAHALIRAFAVAVGVERGDEQFGVEGPGSEPGGAGTAASA